jgi:hypothetical protein
MQASTNWCIQSCQKQLHPVIKHLYTSALAAVQLSKLHYYVHMKPMTAVHSTLHIALYYIHIVTCFTAN